MVSHYRVLGVPTGAPREQIRAAYLEAARIAHPDLNSDADGQRRVQAAERMCALNEAWRVLGDPARRTIYDRQRIATAAGAAGVGQNGTSRAQAAAATRAGRIPGRAPAGGHGNPLVLIPAALLGLALAQLVGGLLIGVPGLVASGSVTLALAVTSFVAAPLIVMAVTRSGHRPAAR